MYALMDKTMTKGKDDYSWGIIRTDMDLLVQEIVGKSVITSEVYRYRVAQPYLSSYGKHRLSIIQ